jgi:hypothetical protein
VHDLVGLHFERAVANTIASLMDIVQDANRNDYDISVLTDSLQALQHGLVFKVGECMCGRCSMATRAGCVRRMHVALFVSACDRVGKRSLRGFVCLRLSACACMCVKKTLAVTWAGACTFVRACVSALCFCVFVRASVCVRARRAFVRVRACACRLKWVSACLRA